MTDGRPRLACGHFSFAAIDSGPSPFSATKDSHAQLLWRSRALAQYRPRTYDGLASDALRAPIKGWDFSWLTGRVECDVLPWDYACLARDAQRNATRLLDIDTGGGEVLASLAPLPAAIATEPYPLNVPIATARLAPLGVDVRAGRASALPVADGDVNLVLNRHGLLDATETARVLTPQGVFLTQQVGSRNDLAFNDSLGGVHVLRKAASGVADGFAGAIEQAAAVSKPFSKSGGVSKIC